MRTGESGYEKDSYSVSVSPSPSDSKESGAQRPSTYQESEPLTYTLKSALRYVKEEKGSRKSGYFVRKCWIKIRAFSTVCGRLII